MIRVEPHVEDRDHWVDVYPDDHDPNPMHISPAQALALAAQLDGSTDIGARDFAAELTRAAEPPLLCDSCRDRNASHGDWCSVCVDDDLDRPVRL